MIPLNSIGTYKFFPLDHSVNESSGGFPQLSIRAVVSGFYNQETSKWEDKCLDAEGNEHPWIDFDMQTTAYLVIATGEKTLLNYKQIVQAFGWDGKSLAGLNDMDLTKIEFMGEVRENTWEGTTNLRVEWIDNVDADPVRGLKKLDPAALKALDGQYGGMLSSTSGAPAKKPAKAPKTPPKPKPAAAPVADPTPASSAELSPATAAPSVGETAGTTPPTAPPTPAKPKAGKKAKAKAADALPFGVAGMTKQEAWDKVLELQAGNTSEEHRCDAWMKAAALVAGDPTIEDLAERYATVDEDEITAEQWRDIAAKTLDELPNSNRF